jgi:hypothetical protein
MQTARVGIVAVALLAAGCGGGAHFANNARPPTPVDSTVYINDSRVSVSPNSVGGGPVVFTITNQASRTVTVIFQPSGGGSALASSAPINPQTTTEVTVDFTKGEYTVGTSNQGGSQAASATPSSIQPATLHIGPERPNSNGALLQP